MLSTARIVLGSGIFLLMVVGSIEVEAAPEDQLAAAIGIQIPQERAAAPGVVGKNVDGRTIRLEDFRGKVVLLNFWATWCVPCREEMPAMERLYKEHKDRGFVILAVNFQESLGAVRAFVQGLKLTFPVILDPNGAAAMAYLVRGLPASYVVDRNQILVGRAVGAREWDSQEARAYIQALLGRKG